MILGYMAITIASDFAHGCIHATLVRALLIGTLATNKLHGDAAVVC